MKIRLSTDVPPPQGIEEADAEPRGMAAAGTYVIIGLLFVIVMAAIASL